MIRPPARLAPAAVIVLFAAATVARAAPQPTYSNVRYSDRYDRCVMDVWLAESEEPTPVVVYFHGGGFRVGDKMALRFSPALGKYLPKGVSFISVNYPFVQHTNNDYEAILKECAAAVQFIVNHKRVWKLDVDRIAVSGTSAGALISGYLGYNTDLPIGVVFAIQQPMGTELMVLRFMKRGGPPIMLYTTSPPSDRVHHPRYAQMVFNKARALGIAAELWGNARSGLKTLPEGVALEDRVFAFFAKAWAQRAAE